MSASTKQYASCWEHKIYRQKSLSSRNTQSSERECKPKDYYIKKNMLHITL